MVTGVVVRMVGQAVVRVSGRRCGHRKAARCSWMQGGGRRCCRHTGCVCVVVQRVRVVVVMVAHARQTGRILVVVVSGGKVMVMGIQVVKAI